MVFYGISPTRVERDPAIHISHSLIHFLEVRHLKSAVDNLLSTKTHHWLNIWDDENGYCSVPLLCHLQSRKSNFRGGFTGFSRNPYAPSFVGKNQMNIYLITEATPPL